MSESWPTADATRCYGHQLTRVTRSGQLDLAARASGGSISPLIIFITYDASANSVATIAKVTSTKFSLGRSSSIDNFCA
jgi:hypothetical protein